MRRNHKLESELAEKIVGYVLVNIDDYFAAKKVLAQQTNNKSSFQFPSLLDVKKEILKIDNTIQYDKLVDITYKCIEKLGNKKRR